MKILRGSKQGRVLHTPPEVKGNSNLTPSIVKEAVFQLLESGLSQPFSSYNFFDLCAGSGQMGFEAASQGFGSVHLAEVDPGRFSFLIGEARRLGFVTELHKKDFRRMANKILPFNRSVLFLDPPYSFWEGDRCPPIEKLLSSLLEKAKDPFSEIHVLVQGPEELGEGPLLAGSGRVGRREGRRYGNTVLTWLEISNSVS